MKDFAYLVQQLGFANLELAKYTTRRETFASLTDAKEIKNAKGTKARLVRALQRSLKQAQSLPEIA